MKNLLLTSMSLIFTLCIAQAQQRDMAEIRADGIQIPVVNHLQVNNPVQGLLVYDINSNSYWYFDGGQWVEIGRPSELIDDDGDTRITVEDFADSDEITFDVEGRTAFELRETPSAAEILQFRVPDFNHGNLLFGFDSGEQIDTTNGAGFGNTLFGVAAGSDLTTGTGNSSVGFEAGINFGGSSSFNVNVGYSAGRNNNTDQNVLVGSFAGENNSQPQVVAVGESAGNQNQGQFATMIGFSAGLINQGDGNTMIGYSAGYDPTTQNAISGGDNVFVGTDSGQGTTSGMKNTFVGRSSGRSNLGGDFNTYLGAEAGQANTMASENTIIGSDAGAANSGNNNTFLGSTAGGSNISGENNVYIGKNAGTDNVMGSNSIVIGTNAGSGPSLIDNELIIHNSATATPLIHGDFTNRVLTINDLVKLPKLMTTPSCSAAEEGTIFYGDNGGTNGLWVCNDTGMWTQLDN